LALIGFLNSTPEACVPANEKSLLARPQLLS